MLGLGPDANVKRLQTFPCRRKSETVGQVSAFFAFVFLTFEFVTQVLSTEAPELLLVTP